MSSFTASGKRSFPRTAALADGATGLPGGTNAASETASVDAFDLQSHASGDDIGFEDEVTDEELLDFLAADLDPVPADPVFREKLRDELWEMVADGRPGQRNDH